MGASGRLQKRSGARHNFPLNPLVYLCLLIEHMEKAKATEDVTGLLSPLVVFKSAFFRVPPPEGDACFSFFRFPLLVKKSKPLRCFELGVRGCYCLWLTHLIGLGELGNTGRSSAPRVYVH